jgi:hypothetical protein
MLRLRAKIVLNVVPLRFRAIFTRILALHDHPSLSLRNQF